MMDRAAPQNTVPRPRSTAHLPLRLTRVIGREAVIDMLDATLDRRRLVAIVGPGGIGKSTVALAVAERRAARHATDARVIDLSLCSEASTVVAFVAAALDLPTAVAGNARLVAEALHTETGLLVLDNCEHVVTAVAELANLLIELAPRLQILATSREALRIHGERVFRLPSLEVPPSDENITAGEAMEFSAVSLFVERAATTGFTLTDGEVAAVTSVCRQLDGIPLAIELAAARMDAFRVAELALRLDDRFQLLAAGRRTALPRQQTLMATLDWSFDTLGRSERQTLLAVSAFRGAFDLDSATAVLGGGQAVVRDIAELVDKSLLVVQPAENGVTYRLLESTRQYAWQKLLQTEEHRQVLRGHALVCIAWLSTAHDDLLLVQRQLWTRRYGAMVADIQAALEWALSPEGDRALGQTLISAAAPLADQLFMRPEFFAGLQQVLNDEIETPSETLLRLALPLSHMQFHVRGDLREGRATAERAARLQEKLGVQLPEITAAQFGDALVTGQYPRALELARLTQELGKQRDEPELQMLGIRVSAQALFYLGQFAEARSAAQTVIDSPYEFLPYSVNNHRVSMRVILANCAAMKGDLPGAARIADEAVRLGREDRPLTRCLALGLSGIPVAVWCGDEALARSRLAETKDVAGRQDFAFWTIMAEDLERGIERVWGKPPFEPHNHSWEHVVGTTNLDTLPTFCPSLLIPRAVDRVKLGLVRWNAAEILRIEALGRVERSVEEALIGLDVALTLARQQGATLWQQRIEASRSTLAG